MKTLFRWVLLNVVSMSISLGAYAQAAQPPFMLTISADPPVVKAGRNVVVAVTMTNTSKHKIECAHPYNRKLDMDILDNYDIRDGRGNLVVENTTTPGFAGSFPPARVLKPGESQHIGDDVLNILYNLSRPGVYTIQMSRAISNNPKDGAVKSNTITVTVTE